MKHAVPIGVILAAVAGLLSPAAAAPSVTIAHRIPGPNGPRLVVYVSEFNSLQIKAAGTVPLGWSSYTVALAPAVCTPKRGRYRCELDVTIGRLSQVMGCTDALPQVCTEWIVEPDVRCLNNNGQGCVDTIMVRATDPPATVPASPQNVTAEAWANNLTVNWAQVWNATSYKVQVSTNGYTWETKATVPASQSWVSLLKLQPLCAYQVRVQAVNSAGTSP